MSRKSKAQRPKSKAVLLKAARLLETEAQCLFESFSINGKWEVKRYSDPDFNAWVSYEEMTMVAKNLRDFHKNLTKKKGGDK
jgi:hypothetical protein